MDNPLVFLLAVFTSIKIFFPKYDSKFDKNMNTIILFIIIGLIFLYLKKRNSNETNESDNMFSTQQAKKFIQTELDNLKLTKKEIEKSAVIVVYNEQSKTFEINIVPSDTLEFYVKIQGQTFKYDDNSDFWKVVNITFAEGYMPNAPIYKYTGIAEVIRNRKNSIIFNRKGTKTYKDIIEEKNQFLGVGLDKYQNPKQAILKDNLSYLLLIGYIKSIIATVEALFFNSNYTKGALGFNKSKTQSPFATQYYNSYVVDSIANQPHYFWAAQPKT